MADKDLTFRRARQHIPLLEAWMLSDIRPLALEMFETNEHLTAKEAERGPWKRVKPGTRWGKPWSSAWFRFPVAVPREWQGRTVVVRFRSGEGLAFRQGVPWQGLDPNHQLIVVAEEAKGGERETILVESGASGPFGRFEGPVAIEHAELAIYNRNFAHLVFEMQTLLDLAEKLPLDHALRAQILLALNRALEAIDRVLRFPKGKSIEPYFVAREKVYGRIPEAPGLETLATPDEVEAAARAARKELSAVQKSARNPYQPNLWTVGHAHIDLIWLWPLAEAIRKCGRTWSTQLRLCEEFPDYVFTASQGCQYAYCKQRYPELLAGIHQAVKKGQWEPLLSMWVESDCIINGGESLVRQFLWGVRWSLEEFGSVGEVVWLPDAFGYCAQLPQIMRRAGMRYFSTTKMWWNDTNAPPMTSFWWQGIDGSRILTHFPIGYGRSMRAGDLRQYPSYNREPERVKDLLYIYGYGDGGGGPERRQVHLATSALRNQQGCPPTKPACVSDFFRRLERYGDQLPTWVGEHYNEFHRGVYTTQARTKRGNRLGEAALREAELWASVAQVSFGDEVPKDKLDEAWELLLRNQFHDVLPGSSINIVYAEVEADYERLIKQASEVRQRALKAIATKVDTSGEGEPVLVFNPLSWPRSGVVALPLRSRSAVHVIGSEGEAVPHQVTRRGRERKILIRAENVPACGYALFRILHGGATKPDDRLAIRTDRVETPYFRITLDRAGRLTRLFDKRVGRQVLPRGQRANELLLFSDLPTNIFNDAWDISPEYRVNFRELDKPAEIVVTESGPVRATLRIRRHFGGSSLEQDIHFYEHLPRIDFVTRVDWQESHKLLKVAFPVDLDNPRANYEIQFGHLERPVHTNTSWEAARFEVPAQKWADLGEPGYGLSLLNDCKHGYDVCEGALRLSLLRAPKGPDSSADMGKHTFTYSIWPHPGDFRESGTIRAAYELNFPLQALVTQAHKGVLPLRHSWLSAEPSGVIVEAVKPAEDGKGLIVRLYEAHGARAEVRVSFGFEVGGVGEVDLIERPVTAMRLRAGTLQFTIRPFEIRTFRVKPKKG